MLSVPEHFAMTATSGLRGISSAMISDLPTKSKWAVRPPYAKTITWPVRLPTIAPEVFRSFRKLREIANSGVKERDWPISSHESQDHSATRTPAIVYKRLLQAFLRTLL
ncbi:hypothetical protein VTN77DRAFT_1269 [Rasamsonia byssochlamydoides]|uniref:uncharacterized protein n=1 Tax=Rasamsonia byssochlamydoides TaxID=89139 RepID=UPI00374277A4